MHNNSINRNTIWHYPVENAESFLTQSFSQFKKSLYRNLPPFPKWHKSFSAISAKRNFFRVKLDDFLSRICAVRSLHLYFTSKRKEFLLLISRVYLFFLNIIANARITNASRTGKMQLPAQRWFRVYGREKVFLHTGLHTR